VHTEEDWNKDVNPMTISPNKGMFLAAISQYNMVPKTLMTLLHILSCFPINMFYILLLLTRTSVQNFTRMQDVVSRCIQLT